MKLKERHKKAELEKQGSLFFSSDVFRLLISIGEFKSLASMLFHSITEGDDVDDAMARLIEVRKKISSLVSDLNSFLNNYCESTLLNDEEIAILYLLYSYTQQLSLGLDSFVFTEFLDTLPLNIEDVESYSFFSEVIKKIKNIFLQHRLNIYFIDELKMHFYCTPILLKHIITVFIIEFIEDHFHIIKKGNSTLSLHLYFREQEIPSDSLEPSTKSAFIVFSVSFLDGHSYFYPSIEMGIEEEMEPLTFLYAPDDLFDLITKPFLNSALLDSIGAVIEKNPHHYSLIIPFENGRSPIFMNL